ncbi:MarR family transcriptional regulator [Niveispirillum irakense]|uniref:MarR family transcriptional regulator n=1 Tax=Niveispirillum irakense TaxID=34011 RepID=UPI000A00AD9F|nr:MarR family transcriptional regulator [Niveispirillum irakense]
MSRNLEALQLWRGALVASVRKDGPDLSARQLALMLTVYLTPPPHTVRGLAQTLNVSKPAITRALDRLGRLGYIKRKRDQQDRRNVLVQRTVKGSVFLAEFGQMVIDAGQAAPVGEEGGTLDPALDSNGGVPAAMVAAADAARPEALAPSA